MLKSLAVSNHVIAMLSAGCVSTQKPVVVAGYLSCCCCSFLFMPPGGKRFHTAC